MLSKTAIIRYLCVYVFFVTGTAVSGAADDPAEQYRKAFAIAGSLPRDADEFVREATRESVGQLERALDLLREAAQANSVDWDIDWGNRRASSGSFEIPAQVRNLARLGIRYHEEKLARGDNDRFAADIGALLTMARHFSQEQPLVPYLTSIAVEGILAASVARNAPLLPRAAREELIRIWRDAPAGPELEDILAIDQTLTRAEVWNLFAGRIERFPKRLLQDVQESSGSNLPFRISHVRKSGAGAAVHFEEIETEATFSLRPGEIRHGTELVSLDVLSGFALLRHDHHTVVADLSEKELVEIVPATAWKRVGFGIRQSYSMFDDGAEPVLKDEFEQLLEEADGDGLIAFAKLIAQMKVDAGKIPPALSVSYQEIPDNRRIEVEGIGFLGKQQLGSLIGVRTAQLGQRVTEELLLLGMRHLERPDQEIPVSSSEVTGEPIRLDRFDGKMVLRSPFRFRARPVVELEFPLP